jgi:superfamily II DNA/RNA helicase
MAVHGDMPQDRRMKILQDFKDQKYSILVATGGLVGRGLDLPLCKQVRAVLDGQFICTYMCVVVQW